MTLKPAVFFDRDGVLNVNHGYVHSRENFEWIPGAVDSLKFFRQQGYLIFVVTNQSGVARGFYTEEAVQALHGSMNEELRQADALVDAFYYCPHHPESASAEYALTCRCRKPGPGMLEQAMKEWPVDRARSLMIGDQPTDMAAAEAAGVAGYLFPGGNLFDFVKEKVRV